MCKYSSYRLVKVYMGITFLYFPFNITKRMDKCVNGVLYININKQYLYLCVFMYVICSQRSTTISCKYVDYFIH